MYTEKLKDQRKIDLNICERVVSSLHLNYNKTLFK